MSKTPVYLNVYDLHNANYYGYPVGLGAFHTGVEINGKEYSFGGHNYPFTGVFEIPPKSAGATFRESVLLGETTMNRAEIQLILNQLASEFIGNTYHPFSKNCNSFSDALSLRLFNKSIPAYINRLPNIGSMFSCMIPIGALEMIGLALPTAEEPSPQISDSFSGSGNSLRPADNIVPTNSNASGSEIFAENEELRREKAANAAYKRLNNKAMA